ncbi:MAG TPA: hypothetical protein VFQ45_15035 [Longimicrobium sp.]|nr:hypothetical protein [Longimicrobium sp.]
MKPYRALLAALAVMLAATACSADKMTAPDPENPVYSGIIGSGAGRSDPEPVSAEPTSVP